MQENSYAFGILVDASKLLSTSSSACQKLIRLMPRQNAQVC